MKFPLSWLKNYIDTTLPPAQIAKLLTSAGIEVDSFESASSNFNDVVVGLVTAVEPHPNADKLCVAQVSDGEHSYQVVCGAPNCRPGIKTAFAKVGASLKEEDGKIFKVKKAKIRGVESFGMLCSEQELQISNDYDGIIEFADQWKEGADVAEMYADTIFEVSLTPNLGHCWSLIGIARELSAATEEPVKLPLVFVKEEDKLVETIAQVKVDDSKRCPRYACRVIEDVVIEPSPEWLQKRLNDCGIRPINNVVDVTNFVLMEMGQPLHAFDFDKLQGHEITVRTANEGEHFTTLDDCERVLAEGDLLICDKGENSSRPIALAGVMGGKNSEVSETTRNVLIESAHFLPSSIRRTSKHLGLQTDASRRFERGTDPNVVQLALDRAAMMLHELAQGKVCKGVIDCKEKDFPQLSLSCRLSRINKILGTQLGVSEVENVFRRLQFSQNWDGSDVFHLKIPTYRNDILEEIDIIEEVARVYGYDNITMSCPKYHSSQLPHAPIYLFEKEVRSRLLAEGLQEFLTCDLIGPSLLNVVQDEAMPPESIIKVLNPTSIEQSILRTSLLPGLLQVVKHNCDHQIQDINGFETGRIHFKEKDQFKEQSVVGIIMSGKSRPHHWGHKPAEVDYFDLKGVVENFLKMLGVHNAVFKNSSLPILHSGRQAAIYIDSLDIGTLGEVHPAIIRRLDVPQRILFAEINLHDLYQMRRPTEKVQKLSVFPCSDRDWTVTIRQEVSIEGIIEKIRLIPSKLLEEVSLLDLYQSEKLEKGMRNATLHFVYRDKQKTIAQETADSEHARIIKQATEIINR